MAKKKKASRKPRNISKPKIDKGKKEDPSLHVYGKNEDILCLTNSRGYATPDNRSIEEIRVDASDGFVPLWGPDVILRWRFNEFSMRHIPNPERKKNEIRTLVGEALQLWGDAVPVTFREASGFDAWDFEFKLESADDCTPPPNRSCVLARAFFPNAGQNDLALYPILFNRTHGDQVLTMAHELGHVFGLRHFFAAWREAWAPSLPFGIESPFSIMNYGAQSRMTDADRSDLKLLYSRVWSGLLPSINGTPVVQFRPYHEFRTQAFATAGSQRAFDPGIAASQCPCCWRK